MTIENIIENIKNLSLLESYFLVKELENLFEIKIAVSPTNSEVSTINEENPKIQVNEIKEIKKEKVTFNVVLNTIPSDNRMNLITTLKKITGLSLRECKDIVDNVPKVIKEDIDKQQCEDIRTELENLGAKIIIE